MRIQGTITDADGQPMPGVEVQLLNEQFERVGEQVLSDVHGRYTLAYGQADAAFLIAVKDYGTAFLEFWCTGLRPGGDYGLDFTVDTLELYGLNVFSVAGGAPSLFVYFRPMDLFKVNNPPLCDGTLDIFPDISQESITIMLDGVKRPIVSYQAVREWAGDGTYLNAVLLQVDWPDKALDSAQHKLQVHIRAADGHMGEACRYFTT